MNSDYQSKRAFKDIERLREANKAMYEALKNTVNVLRMAYNLLPDEATNSIGEEMMDRTIIIANQALSKAEGKEIKK